MDIFRNIVDATVDTTGISFAEIEGRSRKVKIVDARKIVVGLARMKGLSFPAIGKGLNRDHSSIIYLNKEFENLLKYDEQFKADSEAVAKKLKVAKLKRIIAMKKVQFKSVPPLWPEEHTTFFNFDLNADPTEIKDCVIQAAVETATPKTEFELLNDFQLVTSSQVMVESLVTFAFGYDIAYNHFFIPADYE